MRRLLPSLLVGMICTLIALSCLGFSLPIEFAWVFATGWISFLRRVLPQVSVDRGGVTTAVVALVLLVIGLHAFLRSMSAAWRAQAAGQGSIEPSALSDVAVWRFRWTVAMVATTVLMFVAGIAMVGLTHQLVWLARSEDPLISGGVARNRSSAQNNLKQTGLGLHNYADVEHTFPIGGVSDRHGRMLHGWQTLILPYIEETVLFQRIDLSRPWSAPENAKAFKTRVPAYHLQREGSPDTTSDGLAVSDFAGNVDVLGPARSWKLAEITDGLSHTVLAAEATSNPKAWGNPTNWRDLRDGVGKSGHGFGGPWRGGGANAVMADGSVRMLNSHIDPRVLEAIATPAGGEAAQQLD